MYFIIISHTVVNYLHVVNYGIKTNINLVKAMFIISFSKIDLIWEFPGG